MCEKSLEFLYNAVPYIPDEDPLDQRIVCYAHKYGDENTRDAMRHALNGISVPVEFTQEESEAFAYRTLTYLRELPWVKWLESLENKPY